MPDKELSNILHKSSTDCEPDNWQLELANAQLSVGELLSRVNLTPEQVNADLNPQFKCVAPAAFIARITAGDGNDPLLRQVLPIGTENDIVDGFVNDPLQEADHNPVPGLIHKYHNRVLLITSTACAINCRYCFRRNFAYADNRIGKQALAKIIAYLQDHPEIDEVILSGGDPLVISDKQFDRLISQIEILSHVKRLRIHTRLPVVIPSRITAALTDRIKASRLDTVVVLHSNHAQEIDEQVATAIAKLKTAGATLLNQAVLLKGINDCALTLRQLSERLFSVGVLPYYLHLFDQVKGGHHFYVDDRQALTIYRELQSTTSGYLVPKLAREIAGEHNKTLFA